MEVLSYGYKKPQTGDKGSVFFPALEFNIERLNDHTHNGTNSARLGRAAMVSATDEIDAANWTGSDGVFSQVVAMPVSMNYDDYPIVFRNQADGAQLLLSHEKVSATTYRVYINDDSISLDAVYG